MKIVEQRINLCRVKTAGGVFVRIFMSLLEKAANFDFKCPIKKMVKYKIKPFSLKAIAGYTSTLATNNERSIKILITGGSDLKPILSISVSFIRVEVDYD
jgi:hypothetical protein